MKYRLRTVITGFFALTVMLGSCSLISGNQPLAASTGSLAVQLTPGGGRTLTPGFDMQVATYDIHGAGPTGASFDIADLAETSFTRTDLLIGDWAITVNGKNSDGVAIVTGNGIITIALGALVNRTIDLSPIDGTGTLSLAVSWTTGLLAVPSITGTRTDLSGSEKELEFMPGGDGHSYTVNMPELNTGYYDVSISLFDGPEPRWTMVETLRIIDGQTTGESYTVTAADCYFGTVRQPEISPETGIYAGERTVSIVCETVGAAIRYTNDDSLPTPTNGIIYTGPFVVSSTTMIRAFAYKTGWYDSLPDEAAITIAGTPVTPAITPANNGTVRDATPDLTWAEADGATTYRIQISAQSDFSAPVVDDANVGTAAYSPTVLLDDAVTYYWRIMVERGSGIWGGWSQAWIFTVEYPQATLITFSPQGGMYTADQEITLACATADAMIYYTVQFYGLTTDWTEYTGTPIPVTYGVSMTIRAVATAPGHVPSDTATALYTSLIELVAVPGGSFQMGSLLLSANEQPVHTVTLSDFWIGKYEVTRLQYFTITNADPSYYKSDVNLPVERVTWNDAVEFCNALSNAEGVSRVYTITNRVPASGYPITSATVTADFTQNGYRLPTEAEWEYAARGGARSLGYNFAGSNNADSVSWFSVNAGNTTHPVGVLEANELGIFDMSGNVWELCWDWFGSYLSGAQTDPTGPVTGSYRIMRGGSWYHDAPYGYSFARNYLMDGSAGGTNIGFRVVRRLE